MYYVTMVDGKWYGSFGTFDDANNAGIAATICGGIYEVIECRSLKVGSGCVGTFEKSFLEFSVDRLDV